MDIAIQLKKRNLEMIDHRQHVLGGTYILDMIDEGLMGISWTVNIVAPSYFEIGKSVV